MEKSGYWGADWLIVYEKNLNPNFFDLKTEVAGEILQKFTTCNVLLTIVGDFSRYPAKRLKYFICKSNKLGRINDIAIKEEALRALTKRNSKNRA